VTLLKYSSDIGTGMSTSSNVKSQAAGLHGLRGAFFLIKAQDVPSGQSAAR
jgi:hypothetical protein